MKTILIFFLPLIAIFFGCSEKDVEVSGKVNYDEAYLLINQTNKINIYLTKGNMDTVQDYIDMMKYKIVKDSFSVLLERYDFYIHMYDGLSVDDQNKDYIKIKNGRESLLSNKKLADKRLPVLEKKYKDISAHELAIIAYNILLRETTGIDRTDIDIKFKDDIMKSELDSDGNFSIMAKPGDYSILVVPESIESKGLLGASIAYLYINKIKVHKKSGAKVNINLSVN